MTACHPADIRQTAAEAALAVSGVLALQPTLASRLARAASRATAGAAASRFASPLSGIRVVHDPDGSGWQVEVRCVLAEGHRAIDVARTVHDRTRASLTPLVTTHGTADTVTVTVTIIRITRTKPKVARRPLKSKK
ncbi:MULTISPECIES: hypothetical protein [unclassified Streptomyces]|uniref:hypothetical protein n=1 Tax=unclassified Streptomyces TaxID=2593676 RepID=UPI0022500ED0|nr:MULTISPECIES: hypothetical protein [unclassified Streptomyces]MCX5441732.1 hypothetical protein [Streptomyces sp. NBC_00063]WUB91997.1 hypothetical protein OHO83_06460 [Streptomyces sp. NBC_00569]